MGQSRPDKPNLKRRLDAYFPLLGCDSARPNHIRTCLVYAERYPSQNNWKAIGLITALPLRWANPW